MTETDLLHLLLLRAPAELADARLFRRNVGRYRSFEGKRVVHVGVTGQADAYALLRGGRIVEIETKSKRVKQRPVDIDEVLEEPQRRWRHFCIGMQIPHVVLIERRNATPDEVVAEWIEELRDVFAALTRTP